MIYIHTGDIHTFLLFEECVHYVTEGIKVIFKNPPTIFHFICYSNFMVLYITPLGVVLVLLTLVLL